MLLLLLLYGTSWLLLTPNNPINRLFRAPISQVGSRVVIGPYPTEGDFANLKENGVTTIISLLDARVPYEDVLLSREKQAAARFGMHFLNFPMTSFFGQRFGDNYDASARAAATAIRGTSGRIYLHCYLGVHRVEAVRTLLDAGHVANDSYLPRKREQLARASSVERVSMRYDAGDYSGALDLYTQLDQPDAKTRLLAAWSYLHVNDVGAASRLFQDIAEHAPELWDTHNGLGLCALRKDQLATAETEFQEVLKGHPDDQQAMIGMALVRSRTDHLIEAQALLRQVLQLNPTNTEAAELLRTYQARAAKPPSGP